MCVTVVGRALSLHPLLHTLTVETVGDKTGVVRKRE